MAYTIRIGEAKLYYESDDELMSKPSTPILYIIVDDLEILDAIDISDSRRFNIRSPGTTQLHNWARDIGLYELFFDDTNGLYDPYTNYKALADWHLEEIRNAKLKYEKYHPNCKYVIPLGPHGELDETINYDWTYGKLLWYEFWIDWALKNCKMPIITIS